MAGPAEDGRNLRVGRMAFAGSTFQSMSAAVGNCRKVVSWRGRERPLSHRVRAAVLTGFNEVARFVGLDPVEELTRARIRPDDLSNPDHWIAARSVAKLLEHCAEQSGREDFTLLLAECRTFSSLGPVSLLLKHEPSLRRIIHQLNEFRQHLNDLVALHIEESGDIAILR